jgi:hypothetical protein
MTDLAKLVVKLEAQTAQYQAALEREIKRNEKFEKSAGSMAKNIATGLAVAGLAAATAFGAMAKSAIDNADKLDKVSQSSGIAVESLSQLQYAAEISNVNFDELTKTAARFSKTAADAARGSEQASRGFDALGVKVKNADGTLRGTEDLLLDVADKFSKMEDGAAKAAIAQDLFGKSGARLIPFLNQGRAGIEKLKKEADAFGLTVSGKAAAAADQFNDNLDRIQAAGKGVANQIAQEMLPTFVAISERFVKAAQAGGALDFAVKALSVTFKTIVSAGVIVTSVFEQLGRLVYGVGAAIVRVAQGDFKLAADEIKDAFAEAKGNVTDDMETIAQVWSDKVPEFQQTAQDIDDALGESIIFNDEKAEEKAKKAADAALKGIKDLAADLQQQVDTFGMAESATIAYRIAQGDLAEQFRLAGEAATPYAEKLIDLTSKLEALKEQADETAEFFKSIDEAVKADIERSREAIETSLETMGEIVDTQSEFEKRATENVQDVIADALINGAEKGAKGVLKTFVDMLLKMQAQALAAKIAESIFGAGGVGSGGGFWGNLAMSFLGGGSRDSGGRGEPGKAYTIGTGAQPEMFVPDQPGTFIPAGDMKPNITVRPQVINVRDPSEIPNALQSGDGEQAIINVIARNPSVVRNLLQG